MNIFEQLKNAAYPALQTTYREIASSIFSTTADELSEWREVDPIDVGYDEDADPMHAKRVIFPLWEILPYEFQSEAVHSVLSALDLEYETFHYTADIPGYIIAYITSDPFDPADIIAFFGDDEEEEEDEEHEEEEDDEKPIPSRTGEVVRLVPPTAELQRHVLSEEDEPLDIEDEPLSIEDEPLQQEDVAPQPESAPQAPVSETPAPTLTDVREVAQTVQEEQPAPAPEVQAEPVAEQAPVMDVQPVAEPEPPKPIGPVQEDPELIIARHSEKLQLLQGKMPVDVLTEFNEEQNVLSVVYERPVGPDVTQGTMSDECRITMKNEAFPPVGPVRFIDFFYMHDLQGDLLVRGASEDALLQTLNSLMGN